MATGFASLTGSVLFLAITTLPAAGQVVGADVTIATQDLWRGLLRTSRPVVQADGYLSTRLGGGVRLTGGGWASWEAFGAGGTSLTSCPTSAACLAEKRAWAELDLTAGSTGIYAGWIGYFDRRFPAADGTSLGPRRTTHELMVSVWFPRVYLAPRFSGYFDVDEVGGGYLETSVGVPVLGNISARPFWALFLTAEVGYSFEQNVDPSRPGAMFYYHDSGRLTHVDLGVGSDLPLTLGRWLSSSASVHARIAVDNAGTIHGLKSGDDGRWVVIYARMSLSAPNWKAAP
jgi:hypothetical protein